MPLKWKIFRVINIVQLIYAVVFDVGILSIVSRNRNDDYFWYNILAIVIFTLISLNSSINIYLLNRKFPDKHPGRTLYILHRVLLILNLIINLGIMVMFYLELKSLSKDKSVTFEDDIIFIITIFVVLMVLTYIVSAQFQLRSFLKKNQEMSYKKLIESIGNE